jgi:hypothetical protein
MNEDLAGELTRPETVQIRKAYWGYCLVFRAVANPNRWAAMNTNAFLLTAVLGSSFFMASAVARDSGQTDFGRHSNYYGSTVHHQTMHGLGKFSRGVRYHAYHQPCASSIGEESKYPPWSFC